MGAHLLSLRSIDLPQLCREQSIQMLLGVQREFSVQFERRWLRSGDLPHATCGEALPLDYGASQRLYNMHMTDSTMDVGQTHRYTRESLTITHKSATTDHVVDKNHVIGWGETKGRGAEAGRYKRWVKEAIEIRKWGTSTMNRDADNYHLSHIYDKLLLNKKLPIRKSIGKSKTSAKHQRSSRRAQCQPGGAKKKQVVKRPPHSSEHIVWIREYHIYWYLSTDPIEPIQPFYFII